MDPCGRRRTLSRNNQVCQGLQSERRADGDEASSERFYAPCRNGVWGFLRSLCPSSSKASLSVFKKQEIKKPTNQTNRLSGDAMTTHKLDSTGCVGSTIKVAAGHYFELQTPRRSEVDIKSIGAALSKICRFGGHCPRFYSVAEHCWLASQLSSTHTLEVLLHDAAEAYVGDMVKPLKNLIGNPFSDVERRIDNAISGAFELRNDAEAHAEIKRCDHLMLKAEKVKFWPDDSEEWEGFKDLPTIEVPFHFLAPEASEYEFIKAFEELQ